MLDLLGDHPRKVAGLLAALLAFVVMAVGLGIQLRNMQLLVQEDLERSSLSVQTIRKEIFDTLDALNRDVPPDCNETTLRRLRTMLISTRYVADIALLNGHQEWTCTATVGLFEWPLITGAADSSLRGAPGSGSMELGAEGRDYRASYDRFIHGIDSSAKTTLVESGHFAVAIYPHAIRDLTAGFVNVVLYLDAQGEPHVVSVKDGTPASWLVQLREPRYLGSYHVGYDAVIDGFVVSVPAGTSRYLLQAVVPTLVFLTRFGDELAIWCVVALAVAVLSYANLVPRLDRLRSLEYRIPELLVPANILCMYQPIVDLNTGLATGCEVLMRLRHHGKILPPDEVIPAVQKRGLTWQMDVLVVEVATAELARHLPHLQDFKLAFNFFPSSVSSGEVVPLLDRVRAAHPLTGFQFDVEVLEQAYSDAIIHAVGEIRSKGYLISVDDFGTGYSNLGSVKLLAPDFLKIDRSFVRDMEGATVRSSLIPEIIGIARAVGAKLVAEGIENAEQRVLLQHMGAEYGQGYFFSKPMEVEAFARYMAAQQPTGEGADPRAAQVDA